MANALQQAFHHFSSGRQLFAAVYLLIHGLTKGFVVWGLWRNKLWAFPVSMVVLVLFIGYQVYRITAHFSWGLVGLTVFDAFVVFLVWNEYQHVKPNSAPVGSGDEAST